MNEHWPTAVERIATLEAENKELKKNQEVILEKLDLLLGLRHKGIGAFWVISALTGTGLIGFVFSVISWIRGH